MTFYFYDLETSGLDPKWQRIMQFAGQRTDADFNPIGEPQNWLVKLTPDVLPEPDAVMVTGITPQKTLEEGYSEPEFLQMLMSEVFTPNTIAMGYNTLRFDDEFIRYSLYRNFYDAYEREWSDNRGRWDIVDLVRMTRALRPGGIVWPVTDEGKPTNRLELLSGANGIEHTDAHDALSDVRATIGVASLLKKQQPKLFEHLDSLRHKRAVKQFLEANDGKPIVHTSSKFSSDHLSTSVVVVLAPHPENENAVLAYDLRHSPKKFANATPDELAKSAFTPYAELEEKGIERLPVKAIHINKCPALAPIGVLDEESQKRIGLTLDQIKAHLKELQAIDGFGDKLNQAWGMNEMPEITDVDGQLYSGGFLNDADRKRLQQVRNKDMDSLADYHPKFDDDRLDELLLRYKGRNFPMSLSDDEKQLWEQYRATRLSGGLGAPGMKAFMNRLQKIATEKKDKREQFLLEELQLYAQSIAPYENGELL